MHGKLVFFAVRVCVCLAPPVSLSDPSSFLVHGIGELLPHSTPVQPDLARSTCGPCRNTARLPADADSPAGVSPVAAHCRHPFFLTG